MLHVARLKAQHYARKSCTKTKISPNSRKFYVDFALIFLKDRKHCYVPSFFECLGPCEEDSCPKSHPISTVSRIKPRKILYGRHFFPDSMLSLLFKVRIPKYCGKRALQGREKSWDMFASFRVGAILWSSMTSQYLTCDQAFLYFRCGKERLIQTLDCLSVASPESGLFSDWSINKRSLEQNKISVSLACYWQIGSKSTNYSH